MPSAISLKRYKAIVILTGAGISAASGIRTYRGPNGLWSDPDTERFSSLEGFETEPALYWRFWAEMRSSAGSAQPNPAHTALSTWENQLEKNQKFTLITQNVDELHQRAGSRNIIELHGSIFFTRCSSEQCKLKPFRQEVPPEEVIPLCPLCNQVLRPDVVMFGEPIPPEAEWKSKRAFRDCDLFIAIGTSGTVSPASRFVEWAKYAQAETIFINLENSDNPHFDKQIIGRAE